MHIILKAAAFARRAHAGQRRKYNDRPYIVHPARVAGRVAAHPQATETMVAAAFLHDVVEDTPHALDEVSAESDSTSCEKKNMKPLLTALLSILILTPLASAQESIREHIEWLDAWVTAAEKDDLPRVLLIGDSITRGYFGDVEKRLEGKAYCARLTTSKCVAAPSFLDEVKLVLKQYKFAVIHFNNGLHGWGYTEDQYRDGMLKFLEVVKEHAGDAKLIWATTTPVRERDNLQRINDETERVKARNKIAAEIMGERGIPTNDLFGLVIEHADYHGADGVHFNGKGREAQGEAVAGIVLKKLQAPAEGVPVFSPKFGISINHSLQTSHRDQPAVPFQQRDGVWPAVGEAIRRSLPVSKASLVV